jgi:hypothetical protein
LVTLTEATPGWLVKMLKSVVLMEVSADMADLTATARDTPAKKTNTAVGTATVFSKLWMWLGGRRSLERL